MSQISPVYPHDVSEMYLVPSVSSHFSVLPSMFSTLFYTDAFVSRSRSSYLRLPLRTPSPSYRNVKCRTSNHFQLVRFLYQFSRLLLLLFRDVTLMSIRKLAVSLQDYSIRSVLMLALAFYYQNPCFKSFLEYLSCFLC